MSDGAKEILELEGSEVPGMTVSGSFLDALNFVDEASLSLVVSVGELDETQTKILVPFISMKVLGSNLHEEERSQPIFSATLSLEDAAYFLSDFSQELATAFGELALLNAGPIKIEPQRLALVKNFIDEAENAIEKCKYLAESLKA